VIMEAMACGLPVVSTRLAGVPEMIETGVDGSLVEPRDSVALAAAMERLLKDRPEAVRLGERARATARERFAIEKTTSLLKHLLVGRAGITPPVAARKADPGLPRPGWMTRLSRIFR
jgi:glycosyltransferase involved in cell wall biosynthesis